MLNHSCYLENLPLYWFIQVIKAIILMGSTAYRELILHRLLPQESIFIIFNIIFNLGVMCDNTIIGVRISCKFSITGKVHLSKVKIALLCFLIKDWLVVDIQHSTSDP